MFERKLLVAAGTVALFAAPALAAQPADPNPNAATPAAPADPGDTGNSGGRWRCRDPGDPGRSRNPGCPGGQGRRSGDHDRYARAGRRTATKGKKKGAEKKPQ